MVFRAVSMSSVVSCILDQTQSVSSLEIRLMRVTSCDMYTTGFLFWGPRYAVFAGFVLHSLV